MGLDEPELHKIAGTVLGLAALLHLVRSITRMDLVMGTWTAPQWISWVAFAVAGSLSYLLWKSALK
tara:strand:- start:51 stop:248 length:198 start_codon:yes stop_codon:yes gene_type:complete